jgi:hypothetical protein
MYCTTVLLHNSLENLKKTPVFYMFFSKVKKHVPKRRFFGGVYLFLTALDGDPAVSMVHGSYEYAV